MLGVCQDEKQDRPEHTDTFWELDQNVYERTRMYSQLIGEQPTELTRFTFIDPDMFDLFLKSETNGSPTYRGIINRYESYAKVVGLSSMYNHDGCPYSFSFHIVSRSISLVCGSWW